MEKPIVIIGTGLAGYNIAKEIRKLDTETPLYLITADDGSFYSKPMLSTGFTKKKTAPELASANAGTMADQLKATIRTNTRVTSINPEAHTVNLGDDVLEYSKLILAWGADVIAHRLQGDAAEQVCTVNDLADYDRLRNELEGGKKVAIIGAGLIGCEFANDLVNGGYEVELVASDNHIMSNLLPPEVADAVLEGLQQEGVKVHFGALAHGVDKQENGRLKLSLSNGSNIEADVVISAIGLRPRIALASDSGFKVNNGIVVDRYLRTSHEDIFALGDCAEVDGLVLLYVLPLMACTRALAKTLTGTDTQVSYGPMPVTVKTPSCPLVVAPPAKDASGSWEIERDGMDVKALFRNDDGTLLGFALTGTKIPERMALSKELQPIMA